MEEVTTGDDPTQAVLSESALYQKALCDYVINVATGCRHGCRFCYVPSTPQIRTRPGMLADEADVEDPQEEWGSYVLYRDDLADRLDDVLTRKRTWNETDRGRGVVGISFATDCYMDGRAGAITRDVVDVLAAHGRYARVLTRNPTLALQDLDVFLDAGEHVTIGTSIPTLVDQEAVAIEAGAPAPSHRLRGLQEFADAGVQVFVSMSPTYPTLTQDQLRDQLQQLGELDPSVIFHEPINPRGANFQLTVEAAHEAGQDELAEQLQKLRDRDRWARYAVDQLAWVQELGDELDLPVHLWPDRQLLDVTSGWTRDWLASWRDRRSPEDFAARPGDLPDDQPMSPPSPRVRKGPPTLDDFVGGQAGG